MTQRVVEVNLREERWRTGLSAAAAARLVGVSKRTWQRWEAGGVVPLGAYQRWQRAAGSEKGAEHERE